MAQNSILKTSVLARPRNRHFAPMPSIVLVGASTGGPQALVALMEGLAPVLARLPVCVTLHLPPDLMPVIAKHVARVCRVDTAVVDCDRMLEPGRVYFAPGNRHLTFARRASTVAMVLAPEKPGELCRPAVDVMFKSAASSHGSRALAVVLSGMGRDGLEGARAIVAAGGAVLVQDKATSAVWGMPGAVAKEQLAAAILDPVDMARDIVARLTRVERA